MQITLDEKYQITSDSRQLILQEKKTVLEGENKGKEYFENVGYYSGIKGVIKGYMERSIRNSNVSTMQEVLKVIKDLEKKLDTLKIG